MGEMVTAWNPNDFAVDELTQKLIIQLQLEDAEEFYASAKGKGKATSDNGTADADYALQLYKDDLTAKALIISDRLMTKSIAHAVQTDGGVLQGRLAKEDSIARDRSVALALHNQEDRVLKIDNKPFVPSEPQVMNDEIFQKLEAMYAYDPTTESNRPQKLLTFGTNAAATTKAESSRWAASRKGAKPTPDSHCVCCGDEKKFFDVARTPCGHEYCRVCLDTLFRESMTDESLFPPRCCKQNITIGTVRMFLKTSLVQDFEKKKIEFETEDRTYCSRAACSEFIHPENVVHDVATCQRCHTRTCAMCKTAAHTGDCPNDMALRQVLQVAQENNWQRCYSCSRIVELDTGCNHITYV